ncbi:MAG: hypothetical protein R3359_06825 [Marinirhabdus sp.]|nr:hypothetical protein [Marinirhabdus sp.]
MERVKLIWDFRGPNAAPIAEHHAVHLKEFAVAESLQNTLCATEKITEMHHVAYLVVEKKCMNDLRERLKPNRGQLYES